MYIIIHCKLMQGFSFNTAVKRLFVKTRNTGEL